MEEKRSSHPIEVDLDADSELLNGIHYTGNKGPWFGARHTIIIMMAAGGGLLLLTSSAFSVIIVAMTDKNTSSKADVAVYNWTNKGVILSSNMWLGIPIQLIAGPLGRKYGHKWLIFAAVLVNSLFFMLIPALAQAWGSAGVIFSRIMSGGAGGLMGPLGIAVSGLWVPAEERSQAGMIVVFFAFLFATAASIGAGQIVASSLGYPGCCYIMGSFSLVWCVLWIFIGHHSPATHPRITAEERKYIETSLDSIKTENVRVPWVKVLTSLHFWAPVIAGIGTKWIDTMMANVNLIFVVKAWDFDIKNSTTTMGLAPIIGLAFGAALAPLSDYLIKNKYLRIVNARKIFHSVGTIVNALCLLWMTWIPAGSSLALIIFNMSLNNISIISYSVGGAATNILDIAPSFAGIIGGFSSTVSQSFALIAPMTMDWIITDEENFEEWRIMFAITAVIVFVTTIFFDLFASDKREWENESEVNKQNRN